ncbi:4-alpha-glucanotransferase [Peptococcaceae bacterium 1198_IL3148]
MIETRQCGILLHPTSLPSKYGIGDLGDTAYRFIDFLAASKQRLWQVLPLNPVGYGHSPYQGLSAFAGNPMLISIDKLIETGLLSTADVDDIPSFNDQRVEFDRVEQYKNLLFEKAYQIFKRHLLPDDYEKFFNDNTYWLEDYATFMALKEFFGGRPWNQWEQSIASREKDSLARYKRILADRINFHLFLQYIFFYQWQQLKEYANQRHIRIIGDIPIYVSYDSSDTWSRPSLFQLDKASNPKVVAGVPPDYFSETGQLWGNPIYNWQAMRDENYRWWKQRFGAIFKIADIVRIDHFRGFEAYWEIPFGEETAVHGRWVKAPGEELFTQIKKQFGPLPIIAEDLGVITTEVNELKNKFEFPGMRILHFSLESDDIEYFSPYYINTNTVIFTGTHDNDTTIGWLNTQRTQHSSALKRLTDCFHMPPDLPLEIAAWRIIEIAYQSPANTCIIPLQDFLGLDSWARMNYPGTVGGNWSWRFQSGDLTGELTEKIKKMTMFYNR